MKFNLKSINHHHNLDCKCNALITAELQKAMTDTKKVEAKYLILQEQILSDLFDEEGI